MLTKILRCVTFKFLRCRSASSSAPIKSFFKMKVIPVPALSDNYMYLLVDTKSNACAAVDPVEPKKLMQKVLENNLQLKIVLTTHHHYDHAGGNKEMATLFPGIPIYGGDSRVDALNHQVSHKQQFSFGSLNILCLSTPCHTSGHICYFVTSSEHGETPIVFTGDTMFIAGCGRFFEGTAEQMYTALIKVLGELPPSTEVYCGHEYTYQNLRFAASVEPQNENILRKLAWAEEKKQKSEPTIPSTIGEEFLINPFMRVGEASVQSYAGASDPIATMGFVRHKKDCFRA